jgi:hypothetical protein
MDTAHAFDKLSLAYEKIIACLQHEADLQTLRAMLWLQSAAVDTELWIIVRKVGGLALSRTSCLSCD